MQGLISRLRDVAERNSFVENTALYTESADLIESQAAEIGVLKIAHEAHQTSNLKMLAVLKKQAAEIGKYKALCDQIGNALEASCPPLYRENDIDWHKALEAWRTMK